MKSTFFSIIIPAYNPDKEYLQSCINSLINQTFKEIEIIIVDDGSDETSARFFDDLSKSDDRIRVIHQENQGVSVARNNGIKHADSEWIMFVDADDWLELDACDRLYKHLQNVQCDVLQFYAVSEYPQKSVILNLGYDAGKIYDTSNPVEKEFLYRTVMQVTNAKTGHFANAYYSWDKVFKRSFLIDNQLEYPIGIPKSEDKIFILSCYEKVKKLYCVDDVLYHYRMNSLSVCHKYSENADIDRLNLSFLLFEIASRMDKELGVLFNKPDYNLITKDCYRFLFGIISDVLLLKYYHPNNPNPKKTSIKEAKTFLKTEPFYTACRMCKYSELNKEGKLKKLLISLGLVSLFCYIKKIKSASL